MNSELVNESLKKYSDVLSFNYPAVGWYFSSEEIENSFIFRKDKWVCMFMYVKMMMNKGKRVRFSGDNDRACAGPAEYFGFAELDEDDGSVFFVETERLKKDIELAKAGIRESVTFIHPPKEKYVYMENVQNIDKNREIEVINLFPDLTGLASLTALSSYDREKYMDNVLTPSASGCGSVFTVPYNEKFQTKPKSVIGLMDPLARKFIPEDMISVSMPSNRFVEMANNIEGSFLDKNFKNPTSF